MKPHEHLPALVGGIDLSSEALRARPDAGDIRALIDVMSNAEYWLSFEDPRSFEPLLIQSPSPVRELGVGAALGFGENVDGRISNDDLVRCRAAFGELPDDLAEAVARGFASLGRAILARDRRQRIKDAGFSEYARQQNLSVHALLAGGMALVSVNGEQVQKKQPKLVDVGAPVSLTAADERGHPVGAPEIENDLDAKLLTRKDDPPGQRTIMFLVPGRYRVRVPGRLEGDCFLLAR